jgi:hypothetical protein
MCITLYIIEYLDFVIVWYSKKDKQTRRFGNFIYFGPQVKGLETPTDPTRQVSPTTYLRTETYLVSVKLWYLFVKH